MTENKQKWYKVDEVAKEFGISAATIRRAIKDGKLKTTKVSGKSPTGFVDMIGELALAEFQKTVRSRKTVIQDVTEMTVDEISTEILKWIDNAYKRGFRDGSAKAKSEYIAAIKGVKV